MECIHKDRVSWVPTLRVEAIVIVVVVVQLGQMVCTIISLNQGQAESTQLLRLNHLIARLKC